MHGARVRSLGLIDIMLPATLHDVGIITKLYYFFRHFAAFKESMTLNLAQRSIKVIHFGGNRKPGTTLYRPLIVTFNRFGDIAGFVRPKPIV